MTAPRVARSRPVSVMRLTRNRVYTGPPVPKTVLNAPPTTPVGQTQPGAAARRCDAPHRLHIAKPPTKTPSSTSSQCSAACCSRGRPSTMPTSMGSMRCLSSPVSTEARCRVLMSVADSRSSTSSIGTAKRKLITCASTGKATMFAPNPVMPNTV